MSPTIKLRLDHLDRMTDSTGLIQHAIYSIPRRESGYTVDDNARALRLCARLWSQTPTRRMLKRVTIYLSLIQHARRPGGGFHNLMNYQRQWLDVDATGDCQGQAVRALAEVLGSTLPDGFKTLALELIEMALPTLAETRSLRAQAYVILAYGHLHDAGVRNLKGLEAIAWSASHHLAECYQRSKRTDWEWFEAQMTYANAVLPHALFVAAKRWPAEGFLEIATRTFDFLGTHTIRGAIFRPVGNNGWFAREERMAEYDQQPLEAATMADAALTAFTVTELECHLKTLQRAHSWFLGLNSEELMLADVATGACCDGLQQAAVNRNQGAESTLAYLWAQTHLHEVTLTKV